MTLLEMSLEVLGMIELLIKGFIVGIAFIIPGVSGGTLAIYLGIYQKLLDAINHLFTDFKKSMKFLIPFGIGGVISVLGLAKLMGFLIAWNSWIVLLFFIGLLAGGVKQIYLKSEVKHFHLPSFIALILSFLTLLLIIILDKSSHRVGIEYFDMKFIDYFLIIGLGILSATTMIVPGISGSAMLMVLGFYTAIVSNVIGNILDFSNIGYNLQVGLMFGIGIVIGIFAFSKLIRYVLERYPKQTYFSILGFVLASIIGVFLEIKDHNSNLSFESQNPVFRDLTGFVTNNILIVIVGLIMASIGFLVANYFTRLEMRRDQNDTQ